MMPSSETAAVTAAAGMPSATRISSSAASPTVSQRSCADQTLKRARRRRHHADLAEESFRFPGNGPSATRPDAPPSGSGSRSPGSRPPGRSRPTRRRDGNAGADTPPRPQTSSPSWRSPPPDTRHARSRRRAPSSRLSITPRSTRQQTSFIAASASRRFQGLGTSSATCMILEQRQYPLHRRRLRQLRKSDGRARLGHWHGDAPDGTLNGWTSLRFRRSGAFPTYPIIVPTGQQNPRPQAPIGIKSPYASRRSDLNH